jgi:hypothetical protein
MIDREARDNLADRLRKLASGSITNVDFEKRGQASKGDPAIREVEFLLAWPCYDDTHEHHLSGRHALTDGQRKDFARAVLFLRSGCEYRWPRRSGLAYLKRLLADGRIKATQAMGDLRFWPFWSRVEYQAELKRQPYLRGPRDALERSVPTKGPLECR